MIRKELMIQASERLEMRPIAMLVQIACQHTSKVMIESGSRSVNAKSLMGVMALGLNEGDEVTIQADGPDDEEAISEIEKYLTGK